MATSRHAPPSRSCPAYVPCKRLVDPDAWLNGLHGWHVERKVDAHGMVKIDLKQYYVTSSLVGHRLTEAAWMPRGPACMSLSRSSGSNPCLSKGWWAICLPLSSSWPICECKPELSIACAACKNADDAPLPLPPAFRVRSADTLPVTRWVTHTRTFA